MARLAILQPEQASSVVNEERFFTRAMDSISRHVLMVRLMKQKEG